MIFPGIGDFIILALVLIVAINFKLGPWISLAAGAARLISVFLYVGMHYPLTIRSYITHLLTATSGCIALFLNHRQLSDYIIIYIVAAYSLEIILWLLSAAIIKVTKS